MQLTTLRDIDIERIHNATVTLLENTGVLFEGEPKKVFELARKHGCQIKNKRIMFPRSLVEDCLKQLPDRTTWKWFMPTLGSAEEVDLSKGASSFGIIGNPYYIHEYESGTVRDLTESDLQDKQLIYDNLPNLKFDACNFLYHSERHGKIRTEDNLTSILLDGFGSASGLLRHWVNTREGLETSISFPWATQDEMRIISLGQMALQGNSQRTAEHLKRVDETAFVWVNPISPLRYHPDQAENIVRVAKSGKKHRLVMISPEIMMGASGPVTMAGILVQHNTEVIAGAVLAQMAGPGTPVIYGNVGAPLDLRSSVVSHGNFETALLNASVVQMADYYGMPSRITSGNTSTRAPGVKSAVETAIGMFMGAAAGGNVIMTGLFDATLMISYEHLIVVNELANQIRSITKGIETDVDSLAVEVIEAAAMGTTNFMESEHTYTHMRRDIYYSEFCGHVAASAEDWYEKAHKQVKEILGRKEAVKSSSQQIDERLESVIRRLEEDDSTWKSNNPEWWRAYVKDFISE
jgi:trimethylamine---corrinoid protein Co-methyltransferase